MRVKLADKKSVAERKRFYDVRFRLLLLSFAKIETYLLALKKQQHAELACEIFFRQELTR